MVNLEQLIDDAKCYQVIRDFRWPEGVHFPHCGAKQILKRGHHDRYSYRQRYQCLACGAQFDDLAAPSLKVIIGPCAPGWCACTA